MPLNFIVFRWLLLERSLALLFLITLKQTWDRRCHDGSWPGAGWALVEKEPTAITS